MTLRNIPFAFLALLLLAVGQARASTVFVTPIIYPDAGASATFIDGISGSTVVGAYIKGSSTDAFMYDGTKYTTLTPPGTGYAYANAVDGANVAGTVGSNGFFYNGSTKTYSTWSVAAGSILQVDGLSGNMVVGSIQTKGYYTGYEYNGATGTTTTFNVNVPFTINTEPAAISGDLIAGSYEISLDHLTDSGDYGFVYDGKKFTTLSPGGSNDVMALGVSGNTVAGIYRDADGVHRGFLYNVTMASYQTITVPGATATYVEGVSGTNVAGFYYDSGGLTHGFFFDGTKYTSIDAANSPLGYGTTTIDGLSGNTVFGSYESGGTFPNFQYTDFEYTVPAAAPEPSSLVLVGLAAAALARDSWRRRRLLLKS